MNRIMSFRPFRRIESYALTDHGASFAGYFE